MSEREQLSKKLKSLLRSKDPVSIEELVTVCETLLTQFPHQADRDDALYPIWRIHYDEIVQAEAKGKANNSATELVEACKRTHVHLDKLYQGFNRFGNTDHGQRLIYKYWIHKGDCERYLERNRISNGRLMSREAEMYHHSEWEERTPTFARTARYYENAKAILPSRGLAFNQLGLIQQQKNNFLKAAYYYARAMDAVEKPFEKAKASLEALLLTPIPSDGDVLNEFTGVLFQFLLAIARREEAGTSTLILRSGELFVAHLSTGLFKTDDHFAVSVVFLLGHFQAEPSSLLPLVEHVCRKVVQEESQHQSGHRDISILNECYCFLYLLLRWEVAHGTQSTIRTLVALSGIGEICQRDAPTSPTRREWDRSEACDSVDDEHLPELVELEGSSIFLRLTGLQSGSRINRRTSPAAQLPMMEALTVRRRLIADMTKEALQSKPPADSVHGNEGTADEEDDEDEVVYHFSTAVC
jgi:hypothetical protein